jgi:Cu/Ag efflux protein CusF
MKLFKGLTLAVAVALSSLPAFSETFVRGVVEEVSTEPQRLTIAHEPIANLDMDAMTMVFRVSDPTMLEGLTIGQNIEFEADRINGRLTVTALRNPS